jgi:hypothetical protein
LARGSEYQQTIMATQTKFIDDQLLKLKDYPRHQVRKDKPAEPDFGKCGHHKCRPLSPPKLTRTKALGPLATHKEASRIVYLGL